MAVRNGGEDPKTIPQLAAEAIETATLDYQEACYPASKASQGPVAARIAQQTANKNQAERAARLTAKLKAAKKEKEAQNV